MSNKKKTNKSTSKKDVKKIDTNTFKNVIFTVVVIGIIFLVFILSSNIGKKDNSNVNFDINEYTNITSIGLYEFEASFNHDGLSLFLFCSTEEVKCQNEIKALDEIGKQYNISFEYLNVIELVDSEIERLESTSDIFKKQKYPNLLIMKSREIVNNISRYLEKDEIEKVLKENEVI